MLNKEIINTIRNRIAYLEDNRDSLVIDADTHITDLENLDESFLQRLLETPNYYHGKPIGVEQILLEMKAAGVDMSLCWQNPAATRYTDSQDDNFDALKEANKYIFDVSNAYPDHFIPAGWTDPKALGLKRALRMVDVCIVEYGFLIVKMNPAQNAFPIDSPNVMEVADHIVELGGIPAFHYGADTPFTPASGLQKIAEHLAEYPIIAVHMGGGGAGYLEAESLYVQSRALGLKYPNIHFVLSAKRETHIESDIITYQSAGVPFSHNLSIGSDAPYGRQSWNFGGCRCMFDHLMNPDRHADPRIRENPGLFTPENVTNFMGRNFADLVIKGYKNMLAKYGT